MDIFFKSSRKCYLNIMNIKDSSLTNSLRLAEKNNNIIEWVRNSYQRKVVLHHILCDINCKDVPSGGNHWPSTWLPIDRSDDINLERGIFGGSKKLDNDTIVNVVGPSKFFQTISKKISGAIFRTLTKCLLPL